MIRKTHTIKINEANDRIEYEYDYSERIWNIYAIDGETGYPLASAYAGSKAAIQSEIDDIMWAFGSDQEREAVRKAAEMFGGRN